MTQRDGTDIRERLLAAATYLDGWHPCGRDEVACDLRQIVADIDAPRDSGDVWIVAKWDDDDREVRGVYRTEPEANARADELDPNNFERGSGALVSVIAFRVGADV